MSELPDIVDVIGQKVPLYKSGITYKGRCPFHDDHHRTFHVHREKYEMRRVTEEDIKKYKEWRDSIKPQLVAVAEHMLRDVQPQG